MQNKESRVKFKRNLLIGFGLSLTGMHKIKEYGGICIVQEPDSAEVDVMPKQAIDTVAVDKILPTEKMGEFINGLLIR